MRAPLLAAGLALAVAGCAIAYNPDDPYEGYYEREYRAGNVEAVVLAADATLYRGFDGRYYCRRADGSLGLVVTADGRPLTGEWIVPRRYRTIADIVARGGTLPELRCQ